MPNEGISHSTRTATGIASVSIPDAEYEGYRSTETLEQKVLVHGGVQVGSNMV